MISCKVCLQNGNVLALPTLSAGLCSGSLPSTEMHLGAHPKCDGSLTSTSGQKPPFSESSNAVYRDEFFMDSMRLCWGFQAPSGLF